MELDVFITETIKSISNGVINAQIFGKENNVLVNPLRSFDDKFAQHSLTVKDGERRSKRTITQIDFDVAVTVSAEDASKVGGGLKIQIFNADASTATSTINQTTSRIKFQIDMSLPFETQTP
ncbi:hypothetical protein [Flavobacterium limi]|uniref:Uncharacterized protein n=1 Tax=Flavobacterium limi TaxID=2045105 RepID=A0ABQ1TPY7_9FLAO|nr:hypothetical protein [Flavobacterium limi]GGE98236.1 hypothetical protein GCM10011518_04570 [Flavobacterium limi]